MISYDKKFIFIHTPRTGGTSLEIFFEETVSDCKVDNDTRHWPLWFYYDKKEIRPFVDDFFKFSIVRNPWDRFLSYFFHLYQGEFHAPTFKKMVKLAGTSGMGVYPFVKPTRKEYINFWSCTRMTTKMIRTESLEEDYHTDMQYLNFGGGTDLLLRFENLQEDFDELCEKIGVSPKKLPHANKTQYRHKHYREYYTRETRNIIRDRYKEDIKNFGYTF